MAKWLDALPESTVPSQLRYWIRGELLALRADRAVIAFQILGTNAAPALTQLSRLANDSSDEERAIKATQAMYEIGPQIIPALIEIILNTNAPGRYAAMLPLASYGTNSLPAIPILLRCLDDSASEIRGGAAEMLGRMRLEPGQSVPALIHCLNNDPEASASAARSLGQFGIDALPAVPSLRAALTNENEYVLRLAKEALLNIAPEAITNATPH